MTCVAAAGLGGCASTPKGDLQLARVAFAQGDLATTTEQLSLIAERGGRQSVPARLDLAIAKLASGDARGAEADLRVLRDELDEVDGVQLIGDSLSMVADDRVRSFQAAPYEHVLIRTLLAICSLSHDASDAESYLLQAVMKQAELDREMNQQRIAIFGDEADSFASQPIAFAPYMRGVLREATHHDYDDARRSYQLVSAIRPSFLPAVEDHARAAGGVHSQPGHGVLYVIAMVGEGPRLQSVEAPITSAVLTAASTILVQQASDEDDVVPLPSIKSLKVPDLMVPDSPIAAMLVSHSVGTFSDERFVGATQSITDVAEMMQSQVLAQRPLVLARAVARRAIKESAVEAARQELALGGAAGSLFGWAASTAWVATEQADLRCWSLLPRDIQVLRTELPAGHREIELTPVGWSGQPIGPAIRTSVQVDDGRNRYLIIIAPSAAIYPVSPHQAASPSLTPPIPLD